MTAPTPPAGKPKRRLPLGLPAELIYQKRHLRTLPTLPVHLTAAAMESA